MFEKKTIFGRGGPYLTKRKLLDLGDRFVRVYLHQFHRSDEDEELHNHPWLWAFAIVLKGGYVEQRTTPLEPIEERVRLPGSIVWLTKSVFHRVDLRGSSSWSLFIAGPKCGSWYFLDQPNMRFYDWRDFIRRKGLVPLA